MVLEAAPREADRQPLRFDVGGKSFATYASTLRAYPDCLLTRVVDGNFAPVLTEDGSFFVDRDGSRFGFILDYMRGVKDSQVKLFLPKDLHTLQGLHDDANYYGLTELANAALCAIDAKSKEEKAIRKIMKEKHRKVKAETEKRRKSKARARTSVRIYGDRVVKSRGHCSTSSGSSGCSSSDSDCCS